MITENKTGIWDKTFGIWRSGQRIAWASMWLVESMDGHRLVAVPRLRLSQEAALELTGRMPYAKVFIDARAYGVMDDPPRPFAVVHATFDLYLTGEPDISNFAILIPDPSLPKPSPAEVIKRTAQMLRGET